MTANADTTEKNTLNKKADQLTRRAYAQLLWEIYAPALALGALFISLFLIGATAGLWQRIGDPWRLIGLTAAIGFLIRSIIRARRKLKPTKSQAKRRVEKDSGLTHRPLDTLVDTPASGQSDKAWVQHVARAKRNIYQAKASKLRPALAPIDKYFLRFFAPCALVLAFMVGAGDNYERIRAGLAPVWQSGMSAKNAKYEAWIDPPEYTGRPPSYFKNNSTVIAPEGSEFVARISGIKTAPRLIVTEDGRTRRITTKRLGPNSFEARTRVSKSATAHFRIGTHTKVWKLSVGEDTPPSLRFKDLPEAGKRDKLIFSYNMRDDFGVEDLFLVMKLEDNSAKDPADEERVDVPIPGSSVREAVNEPASLDLTKHKWAGKRVTGYLQAVDGKGQIGKSDTAVFVVPDKIFVEPIAKAVAEQRALILVGDTAYLPREIKKPIDIDAFENKPLFAVDRPQETILRAPEPIQRAALLLDAITDKPVGVYGDPTVYMGLRHVRGRLHRAKEQSDLLGIPEDLWDIAIRAEFGILGDALADMQAAERALNNAMARRAPQREVDALFERYNNAVDRYMEELTKKAIEEAKNRAQEENTGGGGGADFNTDEIQELLAAIEEANRQGDTVAARKALARLAQLLENMQIQLAQGGGGSGDGVGESMSEELREALEELNELLGEQRQLRDETQEAGRGQSDASEQGSPSPTPGQGGAGSDSKSANQLAEEQQQLQDLLQKLQESAQEQTKGSGGTAEGKTEDGAQGGGGGEEDDEQTGGGGLNGDKIDEALRNARRAMEESENALDNSEFYAAGRAQSEAIDALRELGEELFAEEARRLQEENAGRAAGQGGSDGDPFGRENDSNGVGDGTIDVPEIDDRQRARDLLEELRRRSGEQDREKIERDYLDRLLERF